MWGIVIESSWHGHSIQQLVPFELVLSPELFPLPDSDMYQRPKRGTPACRCPGAFDQESWLLPTLTNGGCKPSLSISWPRPLSRSTYMAWHQQRING